VALGGCRNSFVPFPSYSRINGVSLPATPLQRCVGLVPASVGLNGAIGPAAVTRGWQEVCSLLGMVERRSRMSSGSWITERSGKSDITPQDRTKADKDRVGTGRVSIRR